MHNLCNCPNCQTNDCPAAAELEAAQKRAEDANTAMLSTENERLKNIKELNSLRTQNQALREALRAQRKSQLAILNKNPNATELCIEADALTNKALAQTEEASLKKGGGVNFSPEQEEL